MAELTVCRIHTSWVVQSRWEKPKMVEERRLHEGPCKVGLYLHFAGLSDEFDSAWAVRRAIMFNEGYSEEFPELAAALVVAEELLTRPKVEEYFVETTPEERGQLYTVIEDAQEYWVANDYATTSEDDEEDTLLGQLADDRSLTGIAECWRQPVTIVRTEKEVIR